MCGAALRKSSSRRWRCVAAAGLFCSTASVYARAEEPVIRFEYRAEPGCPDASAFVDRVRSRTQHGRLAASTELARTLVITASTNGHESIATIDFLDANGARVTRSVTGKSCDEVVTGIALVTALAIDARVTAVDAAPSVAPASAAPSPSAAPQREELSSLRSRPRPTPPAASLGVGLGVAALLESWVAPDAAFGLSAFGELSGLPVLKRLRIGALRASSAAALESRRAHFTLLAGRLAACPVSAPITGNLELFSCIAVDLGSFRAEGETGPGLEWTRSASIFWAAALLRPGLRWELAALTLELSGEIGFPLVRHTFAFEAPHQEVFEVPAIGVGTELSVGARF